MIAPKIKAVVTINVQPDSEPQDNSEAKIILIGSPNVVSNGLEKIGDLVAGIAADISYRYDEAE